MKYLSPPLHQDPRAILSKRYFSVGGVVLTGYLATSRFMATISLLTCVKFMEFVAQRILAPCALGLVVIGSSRKNPSRGMWKRFILGLFHRSTLVANRILQSC
ncbi:hypothetical protein F4604DRAFT_675427 [Suillus subluteus]|nr:hypothetical protein F4604DRAFT_675427 [Suillus subluteus]